MIFFGKSILVTNLINVCDLLQKNIVPSTPFSYGYNDRIAINHRMQGEYNIIRIWHTKSLFDYWYDDFSTNKFIGAVDYKINDDHIKIDYLDVNDDESCAKIKDIKLNKEESNKMTKSLIDFIKNKAKEENKQKIIIDVHSNLRLYDKYYKNEGFKVTDRKCSDNPYWVETEIILE